MDCYVADGYWDIGYTDSDICVIVPAGSPGGVSSVVGIACMGILIGREY